jgi:hypothetical protein
LHRENIIPFTNAGLARTGILRTVSPRVTTTKAVGRKERTVMVLVRDIPLKVDKTIAYFSYFVNI